MLVHCIIVFIMAKETMLEKVVEVQKYQETLPKTQPTEFYAGKLGR